MKVQRGTEHSSLTANIVQPGQPFQEQNPELAKLFKEMEMEENKKKVKGVMIRCKGDMELYKQEPGKLGRFSAKEVSRDHAIWNTSPIEFSKVMGLPPLIHKLPYDSARDQNDPTRFDNQQATFLNISVDPNNAKSWGTAPLGWQTGIGSVILVRNGGKELGCEQARALVEFMELRVAPALGKTADAKGISRRRATVLKMVNWTQFDAFLEKFKADMADDGHGKKWLRVRSPFGTKEGNNGQPLD